MTGLFCIISIWFSSFPSQTSRKENPEETVSDRIEMHIYMTSQVLRVTCVAGSVSNDAIIFIHVLQSVDIKVIITVVISIIIIIIIVVI